MFLRALYKMKIPVSRNKPAIAIALHDDQRDAFVPSYTTLDKVQGNVTIIAPYDTTFDKIYITLEGSTKTFVEKIAASSPANHRTEAFQVFLRLLQPLDMDAFSGSRVIRAGRTYSFPFTFVVPQKLLPQSCAHAHASEDVHVSHWSLPPSLGDPMIASLNKTLLDDMAPEMAVVSYAIKVRITSGRGTTGKPILLAENFKKLRIVPAVDEQPPLVIHGGVKDDYLPRKEREIRKGLFKGKLGVLTMESAQPKSLRLPALSSNSTCPVTTMTTVDIRFDPSEEGARPPRLDTLSTKLKVATFFSSVPMSDLPSKTTEFHYSNTQGVHVETIPLSCRCVASAQWERHFPCAPDAPHALLCRESTFSPLSTPAIPTTPEPPLLHAVKSFYTAQILVPITLPKSCKVFVPTFHSCLVSRVYSLDLYLGIHSPSPTITNPSVHVKVPIQISAEGNPDASPSIFTQEAEAIAARELIGSPFSPRILDLPSPEYSEIPPLSSSAIPSPEYSELDQLDQPGNLNLDFGTQAHSAQNRVNPAETVLPPSYPDGAL